MKKYSGPTLQMYKDIAGEEEAEDSLTSESSYLYQKWTPPSFDDHGWIAITPSQVSFSQKKNINYRKNIYILYLDFDLVIVQIILTTEMNCY